MYDHKGMQHDMKIRGNIIMSMHRNRKPKIFIFFSNNRQLGSIPIFVRNQILYGVYEEKEKKKKRLQLVNKLFNV